MVVCKNLNQMTADEYNKMFFKTSIEYIKEKDPTYMDLVLKIIKDIEHHKDCDYHK